MAGPSRHIIRRQVLEIKGVREEDAQRLQAEIGEAFWEKALPMIDEYLTAYSPGATRHRIDSLALDLGTLRRDQMGEELVEKLLEQLRRQLSPPAPAERQAEERIAPIRPEQYHLELFRYFVATGSLPWWAGQSVPQPLEESLAFLIRRQPRQLVALMRQWVQEPPLLRRIIRQAGFSRLAELAALNMDMPAARLAALLFGLLSLLATIAPWRSHPPSRLREVLIRLLLFLVYQSSGRVAVAPAFWKSFFVQLAAGQRMPYETLLRELRQASKKGSNAAAPLPAVLSGTLEVLWKEADMPAGHTKAALLARLKRLLARPGLPAEDENRLRKALEQCSGAFPDVRALERAEALAGQVEARGPMQVDLQERVAQLLANSSLPSEIIVQLREVKKQLAAPVLSAMKIREISQLLDEAEEALLRSTPANTFSDTDELFVGNAGLVTLWPFLPRFFETLGLVAGGQFMDAAAAHRAVGLLQYLADGQLEPAEYHCGLNKILCGLPWDVVLDFEEPVSAEEAAEGELFLEAVIANAPILKNMTADGFRGSFLLRKGMLRAGPGNWQLHVEGESYDVVLGKFPWAWSFVKLPWMEVGMEVEWGWPGFL